MKKLFTIPFAGQIIVFFEIMLCAVCTLSVFIVNGADAITEDHLTVLMLVAVTIVSIVLLKARNPLLNKAVLWMAVLPVLIITYQSAAAFATPYHAQVPQHSINTLIAAIPVR